MISPRPLLTLGILLTLLFTVQSAPVAAQSMGRRAPITPEDYGKWERLGSGTLSPDGRWLAYGISRVNEENELRIRIIDTDSLVVAAFGSRPTFSEDSRWLAYEIGMSEDEREELRKAKKPVRNKLGLLDLATGTSEVVANVASFAFSDNGAYLAMHRHRPEGESEKASADLIVRTLADGGDMNFGNISEFAWQDEGTWLAMAIDVGEQAGNAVQVFDPSTGTLRVLESEQARYRGLSWRDESADLAALRVRADSIYEDSTHVVLAWRGIGGSDRRHDAFDPDSTSGFPLETRIDKEKDDDDIATVEVWHTADVEIIPEQKVRRDRIRRTNHLAAWHLDANRFVRLGNELTETVTRVEGDRHALGMDITPYDPDRMFGPDYRDVFVIDVRSGERTMIADRVQFEFGPSPGGRYFLYFENDHYWTHDLQSGRHTNITASVPTSFANLDDNHTVPQKPPYRLAGWTKDDRSVLIYDKYDIWEVRPDGSGAERLTRGAEEQVQHRYVRLDPEQDFIDPDEPMYLNLYGEWTKRWGYARLRAGRQPERLVWLEASVGRLTKAKHADILAYVTQDFDDSPDYFVAGPELRDPRQVTETNRFHDEYAWGDSELIDFENAWGEPLQGALFYPANYEPGKKYPMVVYIYELVSSSVRSYPVPSERSAYNTAVFSSEGYFVYRPDITYRDRNPGLSAVEALEPAVAKVLETGMIDPDRIGLVGHSWGGYQTAFTVTQTDIFAAAVAGAPLTNLTSMYLSVYWNSGGTDARIFEISQGRMEVPFWEDVDSYIANSPVFHVDNLNTPLLVAHGTEDGAVDYNQGVEYYNAARRAGKDFVLLSYNGENHGNRQKPNQLDYHRRIVEWFGHYLKGEPAADWITEGVPYEDQMRMLKNGRTKPKEIIP